MASWHRLYVSPELYVREKPGSTICVFLITRFAPNRHKQYVLSDLNFYGMPPPTPRISRPMYFSTSWILLPLRSASIRFRYVCIDLLYCFKYHVYYHTIFRSRTGSTLKYVITTACHMRNLDINIRKSASLNSTLQGNQPPARIVSASDTKSTIQKLISL